MTHAHAHDDAHDRDLIQVVMTHETEIEADHADLYVTVQGSSLVTGAAALGKAREVAQLVAGLATVGVNEADIGVESISALVESGLILKTSSATYTLKVRCTKLESLADLLGVITSQKNADLGRIEWGYPDSDGIRTAWLVDCATRATVRAKALADALGVKLLGVHRFAEPEATVTPVAFGGYEPPRAGAPVAAMRSRMSSADLGLSVTHKKKVVVRAVVDFRVGPFTSP